MSQDHAGEPEALFACHEMQTIRSRKWEMKWQEKEMYQSHAHGDLTSLAPHERLPEILVVPREKTPTGAAARGNP